ncbi:TPA: cytochrome c [bacterium]|nr:cytochrome c [bacterium]
MNKQSVFTLIIAFSLFICLSIIGCASEKPKLVIPNDSELSPELLEGKKLVEERCTVCHSTDKIYSEVEDRAGWEKYVDDMIKRGAKLNAEERGKVLDYLTSLKRI